MSAPDPIEKLIARLPEEHRYIARNSINIAQRFGWERIHFAFDQRPIRDLTPNEPARLRDLAAYDGHGTLRFLYELD